MIPNGVDTQRFSPNNEKAALRDKLELPQEGSIVTIVAALRPEKNHRRFLDIANVVSGDCPETTFLIVGDGPERDGLESYASEIGVSNQVRFLGNRSDIPEILSASDFFMLTSDNEAAPVSIMEAMSCGLPVVASDVGSVHEMVVQGKTGFVCDLDVGDFSRRLTK